MGTFRLLLVGAALALGLAAPSAASAATTVVSLTFDDGTADQYVLRSMLATHGLKATFYVNSSTVGTGPSHLSWRQLSDLAADGHEIGGHTLDHVDLTQLSAGEARRQVCDDRRVLMGNGFQATSFAYPFGARNSTVTTIVSDCGYNSGRKAWGLCAPGETEPCTVAETIPPGNVWEVDATWGLRPWTTVEDLKSVVIRAEQSGGGWVPFVFHHVCDQGPGCDPTYSNAPAVVDAFLAWLSERNAGGQTVVRTVHQVIGGTVKPPPANADGTAPVSTIACDGGSCAGWRGSPVSVTLSATDAGAGVAFIRYTTDGSEPTAASDVYAGPFPVTSTTTVKYRAWDKVGNAETTKSQAVQIDTSPPVSSIQCDGAACSATAYSSPVSVALSATDTGAGVAAVRYTLDGSEPTAASLAYSGPFTVSATTTVKYRAWDDAGNVETTNTQLIEIQEAPPADTTPPTTSISCDGTVCASGWYATTVTVALTAQDSESGVAQIRYTLDGSDPTASSLGYSGPFTVPATTTVKYRAWDNAGNVEAIKTQLIRIDRTGPTVSLTSPTAGETVSKNVKLRASADDGESGVAYVQFYVDGQLVGTSASSPFFVNWNANKAAKGSHSIHAVAFDVAGNSRATAPITVTVR